MTDINILGNIERKSKVDVNLYKRLNKTYSENNLEDNFSSIKDDNLEQVYESGDWKTTSKELATTLNRWKALGKETCVDAGIEWHICTMPGYAESLSYYKNSDWSVISIQEFYKVQGITKNVIKELNKWYDTNKPNRKSKG